KPTRRKAKAPFFRLSNASGLTPDQLGGLKMINIGALPAPADAGLSRYLGEIRKFPILKPEQELAYARRWREHRDRDAAYHLVTSHLRLVAKIAMRYRGYGLPIAEIVSEGNIGLMQAVKRFDPDRGVRLAT